MGGLFTGFVPPATDARFLHAGDARVLQKRSPSPRWAPCSRCPARCLSLLPAAGRGVRHQRRAFAAQWLARCAGAGVGGVAGNRYPDSFPLEHWRWRCTALACWAACSPMRSSAARRRALALRHNGNSAVAAFFYGTLPTALPQLTSYAVPLENNIRAATQCLAWSAAADSGNCCTTTSACSLQQSRHRAAGDAAASGTGGHRKRPLTAGRWRAGPPCPATF